MEASAASLSVRPILDVAADLGLDESGIISYGRMKAKLAPHVLEGLKPRGRLILVSAITPTDAGEGKTTLAIGLAQGLARLRERVCLALREPSLGPVFGVKGGATGGGRAVLHPAEDINLHFNGDIHAISTANNLLAATLDNHIHQGNHLGIDPRRVAWRRVVDLNDRALRNVIVGLGGPAQGVPRETGFDITAASEVMAALCLAEGFDDLRARLSRMLVALTYDKRPVTPADLKVVGALMVLLKDALLPNLVQAAEGVPALVHGGPFANIAHGCNSVLATKAALAHADWAVTEAGFGFDLGGEKFLHIKCQGAGLAPSAVVIVATARALKRHGGVAKADLGRPDPAGLERGLPNLAKHVENARLFGLRPVVAVNRFGTDSEDELAAIGRWCASTHTPWALCDGYALGGEGGVELAETVMAQARAGEASFTPLYERHEPIPLKIEKVARLLYGAAAVRLLPAAATDLALIRALGYESLPLCVAKTQMSLSDDPKKVGRPEGFDINVRGILLAAGAGFVVPLLGEILRMPGLPPTPHAENMDLVDGQVLGVS